MVFFNLSPELKFSDGCDFANDVTAFFNFGVAFKVKFPLITFAIVPSLIAHCTLFNRSLYPLQSLIVPSSIAHCTLFNRRLYPLESLFFPLKNFVDANGKTSIFFIATDTTGKTTTYEFSDIDFEVLTNFSTMLDGIANDPRLLLYKQTAITHPTGVSETFKFDPAACMALVESIDYSGNQTFFEYGVPIDSDSPLEWLQRFAPASFDDPTRQTKIVNGEAPYVTSYQYDSSTRVMKEIVNPANQKSTYTIDALGRRIDEKVFDAGGTLLKQTDFTYSTDFPGVLTETIVRNFDGNGGGHDIKTTSVLDNKGRVVESISYPGNGQPNSFHHHGLRSGQQQTGRLRSVGSGHRLRIRWLATASTK